MTRSRSVLLVASGVVAGTAFGWLTAPQRGGWLRNQARQKLVHWQRLGARRLHKARRNFSNRVQGGAAELRQRPRREQHYVDANTLVDQVHSQLGRQFSSLFEHVNLNGVDHIIYLHGYVESAEDRDRLVEAIRGVEGVESVRAEEVRIGEHPESSGRITEFRRQA